MPQNPHWYTLKRNWEDVDQFHDSVNRIRVYGYNEQFKGGWYRVWDANGWHYWSMGWPAEQTDLINRCETRYSLAYDSLSTINDMQLNKSTADREALLKLLGLQPNQSVLQVGSGSGWFADCDIACASYIGLEPSKLMFDEAVKRHPDVNFLQCTFEDFYVDQSFDRIFMLFGVPIHFQYVNYDKLRALLTPGGEAKLMWVNPTHEDSVHNGLAGGVRTSLNSLQHAVQPVCEGSYLLETVTV